MCRCQCSDAVSYAEYAYDYALDRKVKDTRMALNEAMGIGINALVNMYKEGCIQQLDHERQPGDDFSDIEDDTEQAAAVAVSS